MKKTLFALLTLIFLVSFFSTTVKAEGVWKQENGKLVHYEMKVIYPVQPDGVPDEIAGKMIKGEITEYLLSVLPEPGIFRIVKLFPLPVQTTATTQTKVTFQNGEWLQEPLPPSINREYDFAMFLFVIVIPVIFILIVSFDAETRKKAVIFYGGVIFSMLAGIVIGILVGASTGIFAGVATGILTGGVIGGLAGLIVGIFVGGFAGILAGAFTGEFAEVSIIYQYFLFIALTCFICFIIRIIARKRK